MLGIACIRCGYTDLTVIDTRPRKGTRFRRYRCDTCGEAFNTFELTENDLDQLGYDKPKTPNRKRTRKRIR